LRTLFTRTDLAPPTPLMVAQRSENTGDTMDPKVARAQLERMKAPQGLDPRRASLELWRQRFDWERPTLAERRAALNAERASWHPAHT
jgi:hypothetical protein